MKANDDFELKRALDALPRSIEPPADAWTEVRGKLAPLARRKAHRWSWPEAFEPRTIRIAAGIGAIGIGLAILGVQTRASARWSVCTGCTLGAGLSGAFRSMQTGEAVSTSPFREISVPSINPEVEHRIRPSAVIQVANIGEVQLSPDTYVQLLEARATSHRMSLRRGMIHARITAPPRLFVVETPSGTAVDMGCEYTLHVDSAGASVLHVKLGWVSFENRGRESLVPAGFYIHSRTGSLGIPLREDAPAELRWAVDRLTSGVTGDSATDALNAMRRSARAVDAVTLWHLIGRVAPPHQRDVYALLAGISPPPPVGMTAEAAIAGDRVKMQLWWETLPGTLPITPAFTRKLWMAWLKVASAL